MSKQFTIDHFPNAESFIIFREAQKGKREGVCSFTYGSLCMKKTDAKAISEKICRWLNKKYKKA